MTKPPRDGEPNEDKSSWNWAYLIPMMALAIPILAVSGARLSDLIPLLVTLAIVSGLWAGGRNLLGYQHQLRMRELEAQAEIAAIEADRLREAQKVLDLDDRIEHLKRTEPPETG